MARTRAATFLVAALAILPYLNALDNPFVYDDFFTVTGNPSIAEAADPRWTVLFMPFRPVVNISYAIDRRLWGYRPFGYHLTSVALHAAVSALLFLFLLRALRDSGRAEPADRSAWSRQSWAAFAGAALFAVHPIQSQTAGYVSSRSEILCGLFLLAALLLARVAKQRSATGIPVASARRRVISALGAAGCAVLALLSKEVAAALPVLVLGYDWLLLHSPTSATRRRAVLVFVPLGLITALAVVHRVRSLAGSDATLAEAPVLNLLTQSIVIWRYLGLMLWPAGQAIMHGAHTVVTLADPLGLAAAAGLVALAGLAFARREQLPLVAMGALWWFACIAPSSSVIALRETMAEHRVYVASMGVAMIVAAVVDRGVARRAAPVPIWFKGGLATLLGICVLLTVERNRVWHSPVAVWQEAVAAAPGMWEPRYALADAMREAGQCRTAVPEYEAVLAERPPNREALTNYGICLGQLDRLPEAAAAFRRALVVDPQYARGYTNLAAVSLLEGDAEQARDYYQRAIGVDPTNVHAHMQLALIFEHRLHDYARAAQMCAAARAISPSTPGAAECIARNQLRGKVPSSGGTP